MSDFLVSVVIPIYNVEKYLDRCVESVVNQTYGNLEIVLVDDGSTDTCPLMCDKWKDKDSRIKVIHKENAGLGMARNTGIENATGDYICFFDSDDYVDLSTVEKCIENIRANNSQLVCFFGSDVYDDGRITKSRVCREKVLFKGDELINELLPAMFTYKLGFGVSACMKLFDLKVIKENNIRFKSERELISEDTLFIMELMSCLSIATVLPLNLYFYYKREGSLTKTVRLDRQEKNDIFYKYCEEYIENNELPNTVKNHLAVRYHMYTLGALKQVLSSELCEKEKKRELKKIYKSSALRNTLNKEILSLEKRNCKFFFLMVKYRMYFLCRILLKAKMR